VKCVKEDPLSIGTSGTTIREVDVLSRIMHPNIVKLIFHMKKFTRIGFSEYIIAMHMSVS
jgi:hypothetical protein